MNILGNLELLSVCLQNLASLLQVHRPRRQDQEEGEAERQGGQGRGAVGGGPGGGLGFAIALRHCATDKGGADADVRGQGLHQGGHLHGQQEVAHPTAQEAQRQKGACECRFIGWSKKSGAKVARVFQTS